MSTFKLSIMFLLGFLLAALSAMAQDPLIASSQGQYYQSEMLVSQSAPVIVDGKELFRVGVVSSFPAKERALFVAGRIKALAANSSLDPKNMQITKEGSVTLIKAGNLEVVALVEADATREGIVLETLVGLIRDKIIIAVNRYRDDRAPRTLLINSGFALAATVITALLIWGFLRLFAWFNVLAQKKIKARIKRLESKSHNIIQADQIWDIMGGLLKTVKVLSVLVLVYFS